VPFDLYISRASTFGAMSGGPSAAPKQGLLARVLSKASGAAITSDDFHESMQGAPATLKDDHLYWVRYPDGDPWFAAQWKPEGRVVLSTSYSNHRYLRNFADMFDMGLRLARSLRARLFEEVGQREVTETNVDSLLAPEGEYVRLQASTWRAASEQLSAEAKGALEYPLGSVDLVSEYFLFHIAPERAVADDSVAGLLRQARRAVTVEKADKGAWRAADAATGKWLTKVLHRPFGKWQVWPAWGQSPFSAIAETTVILAEQLHHAVGGEIRFLNRPLDDALRNEIVSRVGGLGVDFYEWTQQ
jgi:hypothetical protein